MTLVWSVRIPDAKRNGRTNCDRCVGRTTLHMIPAGGAVARFEVLERPCGIQHFEAGNDYLRNVSFGRGDCAETHACAGRAGSPLA
jgi:hypothetical protein